MFVVLFREKGTHPGKNAGPEGAMERASASLGERQAEGVVRVNQCLTCAYLQSENTSIRHRYGVIIIYVFSISCRSESSNKSLVVLDVWRQWGTGWRREEA